MNKKLFILPIVVLLLSSCALAGRSSSSVDSSSLSEATSSSEVISSCKPSSSSPSSSFSKPSSSSSSRSEAPDPHGLWDHSQDSLRTGNKKLKFYNVNDFHGATEFSADLGEPGIYKLATYLKGKRDDDLENTIFTSSGDMWQGSAQSNITKGRLVIDWMDEIGFSAMAIGNHEFDWGIDVIKSNQEYNQSIPYLACNIIEKKTGEPVDWAQPYTTITKNGVHIGIVGAIGEGITNEIVASAVKDITFDDPTNYVLVWSKFLKDNGADMILYLQHDSMDKSGSGAEHFDSKLYPYVDLCFAGHSHAANNVLINYGSKQIPIIQAYSNGKDVGYIEMKYDFSKYESSYSYKSINKTFASDLKNYKDDPNTLAIYDKYKVEIESQTKRVCGYTSTKIENYGALENLTVQYMYDYYLDHLKSQYTISLVKHNNARSSIEAGDITYGKIYKSFPFDNTLVLLKVKGAFLNNENNWLMSYYSQYDYYPNGSDFETNTDYYILTINYIQEKYLSYMSDSRIEYHYSLVNTYNAFPRDIVAEYISEDYPIR